MKLIEGLQAALQAQSPINHEFFHAHIAEHTGHSVYDLGKELNGGGTHDWVEATVTELKGQGATELEVRAVMDRYIQSLYQEAI